MKEYRNPVTIHSPIAGYTHQIEVSGSERLLAISGQIGKKLDGTIPENPIEQLTVALDNLKLNLHAAGMEITDLVKVTFYLVGDMDSSARAAVLAAFFGGYKPCMMLLYVTALASPVLKVEIDAWASTDRKMNL